MHRAFQTLQRMSIELAAVRALADVAPIAAGLKELSGALLDRSAELRSHNMQVAANTCLERIESTQFCQPWELRSAVLGLAEGVEFLKSAVELRLIAARDSEPR